MSTDLSQDWKLHDKANLKSKKLLETRVELHQAVQFVGAVGRSYSPSSTEDEFGSLTWNNSSKNLVSVLIGAEEKIYAGLSLSKFNLGLYKADGLLVDSLDLKKCQSQQVVEWLKKALNNEGFESQRFSMELPYEIPDYTGDKEKEFRFKPKSVFKEFSNLYENAALILNHYQKNNGHATDIKCWPHHFDIAMQLIYGEEDGADEKKYVGLGFSPGDENYKRPYYYINLWPAPNIRLSDLPTIQGAKWNTEGWFGATLDVKFFKKMRDSLQQVQLVTDFYDSTLREIFKLINRKT